MIKTTARTRAKFLIPALDLLLQVGVGLLQSSHILQVGGQPVVEVLHGHLLVARQEASFIQRKARAEIASPRISS